MEIISYCWEKVRARIILRLGHGTITGGHGTITGGHGTITVGSW